MKITTETKTKLRLTTYEQDTDSWICICGNTPIGDGFYPCNTEGEQVEPTPEGWTTNWYVCDRCGRVIDQQTLEVVGQRFENVFTRTRP